MYTFFDSAEALVYTKRDWMSTRATVRTCVAHARMWIKIPSR